MPQYTPTEQRILALLADGMPHPQSDLMGCLNDDMTDTNTLGQHLFRLRNKMGEVGLGISYERLRGKSYYRKVQLIVDTSLTE